jgi:hypothetical protein
MKNALEMGSVAMKHIPNFIKINSDTQKLTEENIQTQRQHVDLTGLI